MLRTFSFFVAIFLPPLSLFLWRGGRFSTAINFLLWSAAIWIFFEISTAGGALVYSLAFVHAFLAILFFDSKGIFGGIKLIKPASLLQLGSIFVILILTFVVFQNRIESEHDVALNKYAIAGERLFSSCAGCHKLTRDNFVGPHLVGIVGREVGSLKDYKYSENMERANFIWEEESLIEFLQNPEKIISKTRMAIAPLSRKEASNIVAFLKTE